MKFIPKFQNGTKKAARLEKRAARLTDRANEIKTNNMAPPPAVPVAKSYSVTKTPAVTPIVTPPAAASQTWVNPAQAAIQPWLPPVVETPKVETFPGWTVPTHVTATAELPKPATEDLSKIDFNTKYATFNEAFGAAHKAGLKQFIWKGKPIAVKFATSPTKPALVTKGNAATAAVTSSTETAPPAALVQKTPSNSPIMYRNLVNDYYSSLVDSPEEARLFNQLRLAQRTVLNPYTHEDEYMPKFAINTQ